MSSFKTPMGEAEKDSVEEYTKFCAIKRLGDVDEIANLLLSLPAEKLDI